MAVRVAIPVHNGRVSPVFDVARKLVVAEISDGAVGKRTEVDIDELYPPGRLSKLGELKIEVLLCGAISRHMALMLSSSGLRVIPFLSGTIDEVLDAYAGGGLDGSRFAMPGCRRRRRRHGAVRGQGQCRREVYE